MERIMNKAVSTVEQGNELYVEVTAGDFRELCAHLFEDRHALLRVMFATDERQKDGVFRIYAVFTVPGRTRFVILVLPVKSRMRLSLHNTRCLLLTGMNGRSATCSD